MTIILLTACINPNGMIYTSLRNCVERKKQYVDAIRYYLSKTNLKIVFVENSNTDISSLFPNAIMKGRLECLTFQGNQNITRGKGFGECEIIKFALENSVILCTCKKKYIVKITGRLIVRNLNILIRTHRFLLPHKSVICAINSNLSFPDSRCIIAPASFYKKLLKRMDNIDDSLGYYFEHALLDTIKKEDAYYYYPFFIQPNIEGVSGSTGEIYKRYNHNITQSFNYLKYSISLRCKFQKKYRSG